MPDVDPGAGRSVTVACKLPSGLILREFKPRTEPEQTPNGARDVTVYRNTGRAVLINGMAAEPGKYRKDAAEQPIVIEYGFALTHGVPADLWASWLEQNKDSDVVRNGLIFAHRSPNEVKAEARANEGRRSGMEPMDPAGDVRMPKRRTQIREGAALTALEPATSAPA